MGGRRAAENERHRGRDPRIAEARGHLEGVARTGRPRRRGRDARCGRFRQSDILVPCAAHLFEERRALEDPGPRRVPFALQRVVGPAPGRRDAAERARFRPRRPSGGHARSLLRHRRERIPHAAGPLGRRWTQLGRRRRSPSWRSASRRRNNGDVANLGRRPARDRMVSDLGDLHGAHDERARHAVLAGGARRAAAHRVGRGARDPRLPAYAPLAVAASLPSGLRVRARRGRGVVLALLVLAHQRDRKRHRRPLPARARPGIRAIRRHGDVALLRRRRRVVREPGGAARGTARGVRGARRSSRRCERRSSRTSSSTRCTPSCS